MEKSKSKYYVLVVMILGTLLSKSHSCEDRRPKVNAITTPCGLSRKTANVMLGAAPSCAVAIILLVVLFHLCMRHCSHNHHHTNPSSASSTVEDDDIVNREAIDKCPVFDYSGVKELKTSKVGVDCAVCLGEFEESDTVKMLPKCQHVFHHHCIDTWLPCRMTCPICRERLTSDHTIIDVVDNNSSRSRRGRNRKCCEKWSSRRCMVRNE